MVNRKPRGVADISGVRLKVAGCERPEHRVACGSSSSDATGGSAVGIAELVCPGVVAPKARVAVAGAAPVGTANGRDYRWPVQGRAAERGHTVRQDSRVEREASRLGIFACASGVAEVLREGEEGHVARALIDAGSQETPRARQEVARFGNPRTARGNGSGRVARSNNQPGRPASSESPGATCQV